MILDSTLTIVLITIFSLTILIWIVSTIYRSKRDANNDFELKDQITKLLLEQQEKFSHHQLHSLKTITESLQNSVSDVRAQVTSTLNNHASMLNQRVDKLTETTDKKLQNISHQVDQRLANGFEKTTATFTDVVKRLALIDEAQKKITELSSNVINLQEILADKRARGAFGEVQLSILLKNTLPPENFALQYTLSNHKRVDCIIFLPEPTGKITVDAKFPLESYQNLANPHLNEPEKKLAQQQFRTAIKKHIQDIAEKYIIPGETADGAMMFIPAEAVFAEIHGHYPELIELSHRNKVWLVSPSTLMAILTTACAVIKDSATNKQIHLIQEHLVALSKDFLRFQERMNNLSKHIAQAHADAEEVNKSAKKLTNRFNHIEKVKLPEENQNQLI